MASDSAALSPSSDENIPAPTKPTPVRVTLEPINLHSDAEFAALHVQRIACGWNLKLENLLKWRDLADVGLKTLFWIRTPDDPRAGHISLDSRADDGDPELASEDRRVLTVATLFVEGKYQGKGLGRAAMDGVEEMARRAPYGSEDCECIALNTLSRRYAEDDSEEWGGTWARIGLGTLTKGNTTEDWYIRRGYVKWKEAPKYRLTTLDGEEVTLLASYLKKDLR